VETYQHCPRCRLAIRCRATYLSLTNCPRCLARAGIVSPLFHSPLNAMELRAAEPPEDPALKAALASRQVIADPTDTTSTSG
jgi:tRNA G26 N,N-dimethylase Trm1